MLGIRFRVVTDCSGVTYLDSHHNTKPEAAWWLDQLNDYDYSFRHRSGSRIAHVDALSRAPMEECELNAVPDFEPEGPPEFSERNVYYTVPIEVSMVQAQDSDIQALTSVLTKQNKKKPRRTPGDTLRVQEYKLARNILYYVYETGNRKRNLFVVL